MTTTTENKSTVKLYGSVKRKADTKIVVADLLYQEDDFLEYYKSKDNVGSLGVLVPPYNPKTLKVLGSRNNILSQAIAAMDANIDATGWTAEPIDPKEQDETEKGYIEEFFNEPYPNTSFTAIRRQLREDIEGVGYAFLEVIRNLEKEIVSVRYLDATLVRLCRLGEPKLVNQTLVRKGKDITIAMMKRERLYVQKVGTELIYFKEFGTETPINRKTGQEAAAGTLASDLATELIYFKCQSDVGTPYGVPRWINQLPSIVGSRKAEEYNLDFFDAGGVPPAVVFIQGGALGADVKTQLDGFFGGRAATKHRVAVVEVQSTSGDLNSSGSVSVVTERFGDTAKTDSMFTTYDKTCEEHVRVAFRLPPLFLGRAQDYNFATAQTAYMVTEAQVFQPERTEFDDTINVTLIRGMGITKWKFKSNPLTMKNVEVQLQAIDKVRGLVEAEELVVTVNQIAGLNLRYSPEAEERSNKLVEAATNRISSGQAQDTPEEKDTLTKLALDWAVSIGLRDGDMEQAAKDEVIRAVSNLSGDSLDLFNNIITKEIFNDFPIRKHEKTCGCGECSPK